MGAVAVMDAYYPAGESCRRRTGKSVEKGDAMSYQEITSRQNPLVRELQALRKSAKRRKEAGLFFIEGARLCKDAADSGLEVAALLVTEQALAQYEEYLSAVIPGAQAVYVVKPHVAAALSDTQHPQGVFASCRMPPQAPALAAGKILVAEQLQDPGNMGTILRTAEALGIDQVALLGTCCDIFAPKLLRASMGAVFRQPIAYFADLAALMPALQALGTATYAAVADAGALPVNRVRFPERTAVFIGNEGNGLSQAAIQACDALVTIPMAGRAESLNAAAAAAILMWNVTVTS